MYAKLKDTLKTKKLISPYILFAKYPASLLWEERRRNANEKSLEEQIELRRSKHTVTCADPISINLILHSITQMEIVLCVDCRFPDELTYPIDQQLALFSLLYSEGNGKWSRTAPFFLFWVDSLAVEEGFWCVYMCVCMGLCVCGGVHVCLSIKCIHKDN